MTLRILLVGLVASLGLELPSESDVSSWANAGSSWVCSRFADRSEPGLERPLDPSKRSDCHLSDRLCVDSSLEADVSVARDQAFEAMAEAMASEFVADLAANDEEKTPAVEAESMIAYEAPATVGLPQGEEIGCLIVEPSEASDTSEAGAEFEGMEPGDSHEAAIEAPGQADRLSAAVRMTREAVQAWASLLQPSEDGDCPCH